MKLVIAEKPSVGRDIAKVLGADISRDGYIEGNGYICTWAFGHLITLFNCEDYKPEWKSWKVLPVIPKKFKIKAGGDSGTRKQINVIKSLMNRNDVSTVVCATDAGREGELIFRHIYNYLECKKPVERLWINSLTEEDIKKGFDNLEDGNSNKFINLYDCAFAREKADWLVGMNMTRCFSNMYGKYGEPPLSIGRVQTPTLKLIVDREKEITGFVKNYHYRPVIKYKDITGEYDGKFEARDDAEKIVNEIDGTSSILESLVVERKRKKTPLLFDITSLQKVCNKRLGLSAKKTLDIVQGLYEKKLTTYPRTDSKFLNATMKDEVNDLADKICTAKQYSTEINTGLVIDDSRVSDHHAIIPTKRILNNYSVDETEQKVLDLITSRFIAAVSTDMIYEQAIAVITVNGHKFKASSKRTVDEGWTSFEGGDGTSSILDEDTAKNIGLFECTGKERWEPVTAIVNRTETKPKQRFTEETILTAMENAGLKDFKNIDGIERVGLGTGATRAAIIEVLLDRGYIERKKKNLVPTKRGIDLIGVVPEQISDVSMTVDWEEQIADIKKGNLNADNFIKNIENYVNEVIGENYKPQERAVKKQETATGEKCPMCGETMVIKHGQYGDFEACSNFPNCKYIKRNEKKITYSKEKCPNCGGKLIERNSRYGRFLGCENYPKCKFVKK